MKKYIIIAIASLCALAACGKFDDMGKNPYALYEAPAESFVHPIMFKTQYNLISVFRSNTVLLMQYGVSTNSEVSSRVVDNYNIPEGTTDDIWSGLYPQWGNAVKMYDNAVKENNAVMQGVALILKAFCMMQVTDTRLRTPTATSPSPTPAPSCLRMTSANTPPSTIRRKTSTGQ